MNQEPDTLNLTEQKPDRRGNGNRLELIGIEKDFLNRTLTAKALRTTINGTS